MAENAVPRQAEPTCAQTLSTVIYSHIYGRTTLTRWLFSQTFPRPKTRNILTHVCFLYLPIFVTEPEFLSRQTPVPPLRRHRSIRSCTKRISERRASVIRNDCAGKRGFWGLDSKLRSSYISDAVFSIGYVLSHSQFGFFRLTFITLVTMIVADTNSVFSMRSWHMLHRV